MLWDVSFEHNTNREALPTRLFGINVNCSIFFTKSYLKKPDMYSRSTRCCKSSAKAVKDGVTNLT